MNYQDDDDVDDPLTRAINHPVGHVTEALLRWWYRRSLEDGQGLPDELKPILSEICDTNIQKFRHGCVLLSANVVALFRVDREWTTQHLLPLFDWRRSESDACMAWKGFLWSPRLYQPLIEKLKTPFLDSASHFAELGEHNRQYASLLTYAALDPGDTFSNSELANATRSLPADGLNDAALALVRALEGAGDQRDDFWINRVSPYLQVVWPKTKDRMSPAIAESLGNLCIAAQDSFPSALALLSVWLQPLEHPHFLVHRLHELGLCERFAKSALSFLSQIIDDQFSLPPNDLVKCMDAIRATAPELESDREFERLSAYCHRYGLRA